jgi:hypothetical protein
MLIKIRRRLMRKQMPKISRRRSRMRRPKALLVP